MAIMSIWAILAASAAFFAVGALWYGVLFSKAWQRAAGLGEADLRGGNMALIFGLTFLAEVVIAMTLWHLIVRTGASDRAVMMMAIGFGATIMTPAIGINYLYLRKTLAHFLIDAGHFIVGMAAMGGVFLYFR